MTTRNFPRISGAKYSFKHSSFVISTGIPSLDSLIGGGMAIASIILVESDFHHVYAKYLLNLFAAEGILSGHDLVYAATEELQNLLSKLPDVYTSDDHGDSNDKDIKIAWRYKNAPDLDEPNKLKLSIGHQFDLSKPMDAHLRIKERNISTLYFKPAHTEPLSSNLCKLLKEITTFTSNKTSQCVRRIILHSLGSPSWGFCYSTEELRKSYLKFFASLHLIIQDTSLAVFITISNLLPNILARIYHYCDYVFRVHGFDDQMLANPAYADFDGLFTIIQIPWIGDFLEPAFRPPTLQWCFKIKRRQFILQQLHLPPCLSETTNRSTIPEPVFSCSSTLNNRSIDF